MKPPAPNVGPIAIARSGTRLNLLAPSGAAIKATDIADGLAKINRYAGATHTPFSVAQHSGLVAHAMYLDSGPLAALYGHLHDAKEIFSNDLYEPFLAAIEARAPGTRGAIDAIWADIDRLIHIEFDLDWPMPAATHRVFEVAHRRVELAEQRDLLSSCDDLVRAAFPLTPIAQRIVPATSWIAAADAWRVSLARYAALAGIRQGRAYRA